MCCAANLVAQRISIYASLFGFLSALHLTIVNSLLIEVVGTTTGASFQQLSKYLLVGAKINFFAHAH
jgi:hypothetical protein